MDTDVLAYSVQADQVSMGEAQVMVWEKGGSQLWDGEKGWRIWAAAEGTTEGSSHTTNRDKLVGGRKSSSPYRRGDLFPRAFVYRFVSDLVTARSG